jgi:hypothetical protein
MVEDPHYYFLNARQVVLAVAVVPEQEVIESLDGLVHARTNRRVIF